MAIITREVDETVQTIGAATGVDHRQLPEIKEEGSLTGVEEDRGAIRVQQEGGTKGREVRTVI